MKEDPPKPPISKTIVLQNQKANTTFQKTTDYTSKLGSEFSIFVNYTNNNSNSSTASYMPKSGNYILRICFGSVEPFPESSDFGSTTSYGLFLNANGNDNALGICTIIEGFGFSTAWFEFANVNNFTGNHKALLTLQLGSSNSSDITFKFFVDGKKGSSSSSTLESSACVGKVIIGNQYSRYNGEVIEGDEESSSGSWIPGGGIGGIIGGGSTGGVILPGGSTSGSTSTGPYSLNTQVTYHEISLITSKLTDAEAKELTTL